MVTLGKGKKVEINKWVRKAERYLEIAVILADYKKQEGPISRVYYCSLYCATALLLLYGHKHKTHSAVIGEFGRVLVKQKKFPKKYGHFFNKMFKFRQNEDYFNMPQQLSRSELKQILKTANNFIWKTKLFIKRKS